MKLDLAKTNGSSPPSIIARTTVGQDPITRVAPALTATTPVQPRTVTDELLTVSELALILKCKESSIYNLTRRRGQARYDNPIPVLRLPMGLRFRKSSVLAWLESQEQRGGVQ